MKKDIYAIAGNICMERIVLHSDVDHCYAQIELREHPEWRGRPLAVGGDQKERHGIILAKCPLAKKAGVKTGQAIWQAQELCRDIRIVHPNMELYVWSTDRIREIYSAYTDRVEGFGIDESFIDVTGCTKSGLGTAEDMQRHIYRETGLTVSIGISWNKVFAKLGSDLRKPNGICVITRENYRDTVWPLPVEDLLMVGPATKKNLNFYGIRTIGQLAACDPEFLQRRLGKHGLSIYAYANGLDNSRVRGDNESEPEKSIGNSWTTPRDLISDADVWVTLTMLCGAVGMRLRKAGCRCAVVEYAYRTTDLRWRSHQRKLKHPTDITKELLDISWSLYREANALPLRSIGVRASGLIHVAEPEQMDLFTDYASMDKQHAIDTAVDIIRRRFGYDSIQRGTRYLDSDLGSLNALKHTVHPVGFADG